MWKARRQLFLHGSARNRHHAVGDQPLSACSGEPLTMPAPVRHPNRRQETHHGNRSPHRRCRPHRPASRQPAGAPRCSPADHRPAFRPRPAIPGHGRAGPHPGNLRQTRHRRPRPGTGQGRHRRHPVGGRRAQGAHSWRTRRPPGRWRRGNRTSLCRRKASTVFPRCGKDQRRVIGILAEALRGRDDLGFGEVIPHVRHEAGEGLSVQARQ